MAIKTKRRRSIAAHGKKSSPTSQVLRIWRTTQYVLLLAGFALVATLIHQPDVGIDIFWNMFIPAAPALIVIAPGLWRNICPLATFSLLPRRLGLSRQAVPKPQHAAWLSAAGLTSLLLIVPLRHISLDTSGPMTALMLVVAAVCAFALGSAYEWRGAWCNSLCPIHPAEKLYGLMPAITVPNARCDNCSKCYTPCPDSTRSMNPAVSGPSRMEKAVGHIMVGGFPGFIWGWYQIPDYRAVIGASEITAAYAWPFGCALATLFLYRRVWKHCHTPDACRKLIKVFATAAVCTYYWYRIPLLAGFGPHPGSGMLKDLHLVLPDLPLVSRILTTSFFIWFMLFRDEQGASWMTRPDTVAETMEQGI